jgi:hypothetical protein
VSQLGVSIGIELDAGLASVAVDAEAAFCDRFGQRFAERIAQVADRNAILGPLGARSQSYLFY